MSDLSLNQFAPAMEELGIDPSALDASDLELGDNEASTEASTEESSEGESEEIESEDTIGPEGEEKATQEEAPATEEVVEEPKTAKEIQEIESQRAAFEAEKIAFQEERQKIESEFVQQHAEKLKAHDELDTFLSHLANKDPELFGLLQEEFKDHSKSMSNPIVESLRKQQEETTKTLNEIKQKFSDEVTRTKYDAELNQVKSTIGKDAEALGIKADWKLVEDVWADNPKLSLEEAFHAKYGATLAKAAASRAKVEAVEKKVQSRPAVATAGTVTRSTSRPSNAVPSDAFDAVRYFARQAGLKT